ncbi:MAG: cupin domain-containing protein [Caldilineaceae bacterium]|nr:cupin domain-containing protein [Caldilineaceae bacterium]
MTQSTGKQATFYADIKAQAVFGEQGPRPQFLVDEANFKVILGGLEAGQQIPVHPEALALYYFLAGTGTMTVNDEQYPITPGATVITPAGARRGMQAETRVIFLAAKPA